MLGREWADAYFYLVPESSGTEGKWSTYPYQIGLINWMTSDDIEVVNFQKSKRVGYTKCLLAAMGYLIHQKSRNIATWQPTDGDAKEFVLDEVEPLLRDVDELGDMLRCAVGAKHKYNTNKKKVFVGSTWDIKGGKSAKNYRRMTKDVAGYDEVDAFDPDIDGEGSCFKLGDGRLDQAPFPKSIRGSTPKIKRTSQIERALAKSERVMRRYVKCPHCGHLQPLEFANLKWDKGEPSTAHFACTQNGCVMYYSDYATMDANGRWQTSDGYYYNDSDDRFYDPEDKPIPKPRSMGAQIWAAYSYLRPWSYIVSEWEEAQEDAKTGDITTLKTVVNTVLGETWEDKGESVESTGFTERLEDYTPDEIPVGVLVITIGADVQYGKNARVELEVLGHGLEGETWSIDYVIIPGDIDSADMHDHLDDQLRRVYRRADGVEIKASGMFIDSGGLNTTAVYRYTSRRKCYNVYATKGVNTGTLCNKGSWQGDKKSTRTILRTINVDEAKEIVYRRLAKTEAGPGYCHFPAHYNQRYFDQLTNEEKREKRKSGRLAGYEWVLKKPSLGNEPLDCRVYNLGCLEHLNPNLAQTKYRLERQAEAIANGITVSGTRKRRIRSRGV